MGRKHDRRIVERLRGYDIPVDVQPEVDAFIEAKLPKGGILGFDGRVVNARWGAKLAEIATAKSAKLFVKEDLILNMLLHYAGYHAKEIGL